jgi:uroporphyrinogen decarboxylase
MTKQKQSSSKQTPRDRILQALRHEPTDRVPIDFGGMASTGIMAMAYDKLKKHLGMTSGQIRIIDIGQQLAEVELEVLERFGGDVIPLSHSLGEAQPNQWKPWALPNGVDCWVPAGLDLRPNQDDGGWLVWEERGPVRRMAPDAIYFTRINPPLRDAQSPADLKDIPIPMLTDEKLKKLAERAKLLYETTDYAIMAGFGGSVLEMGQKMRGWERFMEDLAEGGAFTEDLIHGMVAKHLQNLELYLQAVGDYVQVIQFGDDLGTQDRPQMSRRMYQRLIKPGHEALYQFVHQHSDCKVFLHSCGSITPLIPDLIEVGVDILNPVQTSANNMAPDMLKEKFGEDLVFWGGGCDTQSVLSNVAPKEIEAHVTERLKIFTPGGGFVFNQIHNIQANVPPENVVAMFDTAQNFQIDE